jgi:hypothetical protein
LTRPAVVYSSTCAPNVSGHPSTQNLSSEQPSHLEPPGGDENCPSSFRSPAHSQYPPLAAAVVQSNSYQAPPPLANETFGPQPSYVTVGLPAVSRKMLLALYFAQHQAQVNLTYESYVYNPPLMFGHASSFLIFYYYFCNSLF